MDAEAPTIPPRRILLVDDHARFRQTLREFLPGTATEVFECASGADALPAYVAHRPDVVLMDLKMPGGDGLFATRAILQHFPEARVVMVSQFDSEDLRDAARAAGALAFVHKDQLASIRPLVDQILHSPQP